MSRTVRAPERPAAQSLAAAWDALEAGDAEAALAAAVEAWRSTREPRIADLVDRVAARIARPAIAAKKVPERSKAWLEIARKKDPADVGRLLAATWPGMWAEAAKWMRALLAFPHDPRIALEIARQLDARRYRTPNAHRYYSPLFDELDKLADVRVIPLLEAKLARMPPLNVPGAVRIEAATIARLRAHTRAPLDAATDDALARLEARFADDIAGDAVRARGEADFVAAIYAEPDDAGVRQVFADWLLERGDPRGELIALQLAANPSTNAQRREAALLAKHGAAWAGPLDRLLRKQPRLWEGGFVAGGVLTPAAHDPMYGLDDPAWATVRELELPADLDASRIVELPWVRRLRALRGLPEPVALAVLRGEPREALRELAFAIADGGDRAARDALATARGAPNLERLTISLPRLVTPATADLGWLFAAPVVRGLKRLTLRGRAFELADWLEVTEPLAIAETGLELASYRTDGTWRFVATRDADMRLHLFGEPVGPSTLPNANELRDALATLPADSLVELAIARTRVSPYGEDELRAIGVALRRFTGLSRIDVPWAQLEPAREAVELDLFGADPGEPQRLRALWKLVTAPPFALRFDALDINGGSRRALGSDPLAELAAAIERPMTVSVKVYASDGAHALRLVPGRDGHVVVRWPVPERVDDELLDAIVRAVELGPFSRGGVPFAVRPEREQARGKFRLVSPGRWDLGWIAVVEPERRSWLPHDDLAALVEHLPWVRLIGRHASILVTGPSPRDPPDAERQRALQDAVAAIVIAEFRRRCGYDYRELAIDALASAGMTPTSPPDADPYDVWFSGNGRSVGIRPRFDDGVTLFALGPRMRPLSGPAMTRAEASALLARLVARLDR